VTEAPVQQQQQEDVDDEDVSPGGASERAQWTASDRGAFLEHFKQQGKHWKAIAERIPGKTPVQCRSFYTNNKDKLGLDDLIPSHMLLQQKGKARGRSRVYSSTNTLAAAAAGEAPDAAAAAGGAGGLHSPDAAEIMQAAFAPAAAAAAAGGLAAHQHAAHDLAEAAAAAAMAASMHYGHGYDAAAAAAGVSEAEWWAVQEAAMQQQRLAPAPAPVPHPPAKKKGGGKRLGGKRKQPDHSNPINRHPNLAAVLQAAAHLLDEDDDYEPLPAAEEVDYSQGMGLGMSQYNQAGAAGYAAAAGKNERASG
jgi:hypothetical protein